MMLTYLNRLPDKMMPRVIPYEHRGGAIRTMTIESAEEARSVYTTFQNEQDVWLKKMLAAKLLDYITPPHAVPDIDHHELTKALECRIVR